ncbi:hypothetical protein GCM10009122_37750 [Fulvivirga kasyanovii]|uniref:Uncharacterized protein n=1 Tax=Fulvivirga kasyanovii TaxID=396812 RepID=A0ABW9RLL5_9BACT|nr:hypothetical protein [Fulvivirga kasyanovii]MTI24258.1 hypothetical protein [Fulvivirga kasyanovii]
MRFKYLYRYVFLLLFIAVITEAKSQKVAKWEEGKHEKHVLSVPLKKEFNLTFEVENYDNYELVLEGNDNSRTSDMFRIAFRHYQVSFGHGLKIPYNIGDIIALEYNSNLLQVMVNGHNVFTKVLQETPARIIYRSTEHLNSPPKINLIK